MALGTGAAWASGALPPWMEQPPSFDEAAAADRADMLTERFGPIAGLAAERNQTPRPRPAPRRRNPAADDTPADYARRRALLEGALHPTGHPTVGDSRRAA